MGYGLNVYVLMLNALSHENVSYVQPMSGKADTDGWLATAEGQIWVRTQTENYPAADAEALYNDRVREPGNWGSPKMLRFGIQANF
jgi:hypothetical protein